MAKHNPTHSDVKKSQVYMEQMSWDDTFEVLARIPLTLNPVSNALERSTAIQGNSSLKLTYTDGNLTKIEKTVGVTKYTKLLVWDSGKLTDISSWS
jgi:hypothetical protein